MWYKNSHFRNLVDMHIPSGIGNFAEFDAKQYAKMMKLAGVDEAYVYASNCLGLCLYPSKIGYRHSITETRDIFGETVKALREEGIGVIGYLNSWTTECAMMHPEWRIVEHGHKNQPPEGRCGQCCINTPYRKYFTDLVYEMCSTYDIDGLWVDMVGMYSAVCTCDSCKAKFKAETGLELPTVVDFESEDFARYLKFKYDSVSSYASEICDAAHRAKPGISTSIQCATWGYPLYNGLNDEYFKTMDYVSGDFYENKDSTDVICRLLYNITEKHPFEYMISRAPDLTWHTSIKSESEIMLQAYTSLLCGGSFLFIDAIDPAGTLNPKLYEIMGRTKAKMEPFFKVSNFDDKIIRDVAVYVNADSYMDLADNGKDVDALCLTNRKMQNSLYRLNNAMMRAHIDYDVLRKNSVEKLSNYKVVILPDVVRLSDYECEKLREYVANGGILYASGKTSLFDVKGGKAVNFKLNDVFGVDYVNTPDRYPVYEAPASDMYELFAPFDGKYPAMSPEQTSLVKVRDGVKVLATVVYPFTDARNPIRFKSTLSNPPYDFTDIPAMVENKYGKGKCIYNTFTLERSPEFSLGEVFTRIIRKELDNLGGSLFESNESEVLEHAVKKCIDGNKYKICLLSYQESKNPIVMHDVRFSVLLDIAPKKAYTVTGNKVDFEISNGRINFTLSKLDMYDEIIIEY